MGGLPMICEKLLIRNTKVRIKLTEARLKFYMLSDNPNVVSLKFVDCSLFIRTNLVAESNHQNLLRIWKGNLLNTITWKL